jgi:hypothetical protein
MGRIARGWELVKESWGVLRKDKELLIFPVLSSLACLLVVISFVAPLIAMPDVTARLFAKQQVDQDLTNRVVAFLIGFAFYFVNYFVVVFFNVALVSCAIIRFKGGDPTVGDGLRAAASRLPQILAWTALAATVGMILRALEERLSLLGKIVVGLIGVAWSIAIYFVVPVLAVERLGPVAAVKRSAQVLSRTWGESLVGNLSMGGIGLLLALPGIAVLMGSVFVGAYFDSMWIAIIIGALGLVYLVLLSIVLTTLQQVFLAGTYLYAAEGQIPRGFSEDLVRSAFRKKGSRDDEE